MSADRARILVSARTPVTGPTGFKGGYAAFSGVVILVTVVFGVYSGVAGLWG